MLFNSKKQKQQEKDQREQEENKKEKLFTILSWVYVGFAALMTLGSFGTGDGGSAILILISLVLALPIAPIRKVWNMILVDKPEKKSIFRKQQKKKASMKILKPCIIGLVFIFGVLMASEKSTTEKTEIASTIEEATVESVEETTEVVTEDVIPETETAETIETTEQTKEETEEAEKTEKTEEKSTETALVTSNTAPVSSTPEVSVSDVAAYSGKAYEEVNGNIPYFTDSELVTTAFETYSNLDSLGRCGVAYANICKEIMPTEERGAIGSVKPTGWQTIKYDNVDGKYLYNRCHLIGFQLAGENANNKNLITGTRYMNVDGMLPFENMVADYVKETNNHVLYRVTPVFDGNNLVASGVLMEAKSVEDNGDGILFNVYCYNNQPGIVINYADGSSQSDGTNATASTSTDSGSSTKKDTSKDSSSQSAVTTPSTSGSSQSNPSVTVPAQEEPSGDLVWVPTNGGKKYHSKSSCSGMKEPMQVTKETAEANGYTPCGRCY